MARYSSKQNVSKSYQDGDSVTSRSSSMEFSHDKPMSGGNRYEENPSKAGAGRGAGDNPEARKRKNEDAASGKTRLTTDDKRL